MQYMSVKKPDSLRSQLIGAWELKTYVAINASDESDRYYPMGPDAKGFILYTPDGYMSAQLFSPGQEPFGTPLTFEGSEQEWAQVGKSYIAYSGQYYLDEKDDADGRPILRHHMRVANQPYLVGDTQRRVVRIREEADGRYLYLGLEGLVMLKGVMREIQVRWRRMPDNQASCPPSGS